MPDKELLKTGQEFPFGSGNILRVQLVRKGLTSEQLEVLLNGQPLPGSSSDPNQRLAIAYWTLFFIAGFNILLGGIAELVPVDALLELGVGLFSVLFGVIMGVMGFLVMKRSRIALGAAIGLLIADGLAALIWGDFAGEIIMRIVLIMPMFGGFEAIQQLNEREKTKTTYISY